MIRMKSNSRQPLTNETEFLERVWALVARYLECNRATTSPVLDYKSPQKLKDSIDFTIAESGASFQEILDATEFYLARSVKTHKKFFFNQLYGGFSVSAFLGEIITALTNTSMYTYEVAPLATLIEIELVRKMNAFVGFPKGTGQFVTGGSNANLIAILCARNRFAPKTKKEGFLADRPLVMFISDQAHYSFLKAANVLGIGTNNVVHIKTDKNGRMLPEFLEKEIVTAQRQGNHPFFVAATAGTTVVGAFDPIDEVAAIAKKYNLWFHVDGAFGGSALLSRKHRSPLSGSNEADSFTWDPHKMMTIPLICSVLLVKDESVLREVCSSSRAEYLFHDHEHQAYDLGPISLQCGRRVDALKLWLSWKYYGDKGYEKRIDKLFELADYATELVVNETHLELMHPTQSVTVCFRYNPGTTDELDTLNLNLRDRLLKRGETMINYSYLRGQVILRLVFVNPEVTNADVEIFLKNVLKIGKLLTQR